MSTRQALLLVLPLSFACTTMSITTSLAPAADFGRYRTFAFKPPPAAASPGLPGSLAEQTLEHAVRTELAAKGITENAEKPDFLVAYHLVAQQKLAVDDWGYGWGSGPYWGPPVVTEYTEGTFTLDFVDLRTAMAFWHGPATKTIDDPESQKNLDQIEEAMRKMLARYSPEREAPTAAWREQRAILRSGLPAQPATGPRHAPPSSRSWPSHSSRRRGSPPAPAGGARRRSR